MNRILCHSRFAGLTLLGALLIILATTSSVADGQNYGQFNGQNYNGQNYGNFYGNRAPKVSRSNAMRTRASQQRRLVIGNAATRRGDPIIVEINIATQVDNQNQTRLQKKSSATANTNASATGAPQVDLDYDSTSDRKHEGDATMRESRKLVDRITVTVRDIIYQNGDMLVQGRREVNVQGDVRTMVLTGIVRPRDLTDGNTISSELIRDLKIKYEGQGAEQHYTREGWLKKGISKIWPF